MNEHVAAYLQQRWPDGLLCSLCGGIEWISPPDGPHVLEGQPMQADGWAPPVGAFVIICVDCGHVVLLYDDIVRAPEELPDSCNTTDTE